MLLSPRDTSYAVASAYQLRPTVARRISRLRVSWFVLGTLFGAAVGAGMIKLTESHPAAVETPAKAAVMPVAPAEPPAAQAAPVLPPVEKAEPAPPALELPADLSLKMQRKETLASLLTAHNVSHEDVLAVYDGMKKLYNPKRVTSGKTLTLHLDASPQDKAKPILTSMVLDENPITTLTLTRTAEGGFTAKEATAPVYKGLTHAGGTIRSSLYQTAIDSGIPVKMVGEIIQAFSYDVDFARDIHPGDKLDVVFERSYTAKNITTGVGQMQYASLVLDGETYRIFRHTSADGFTGYYNARGESVRKALLKTPINGARVTSGFGMRMHPLLGYTKMHKGIDFGAPIGTPIYAAGDGVIEEAGRKGGYGNYVRLKHNAVYSTAYGHASRIARGIRPGVHVRQGQIIAYVGSTGQSTGPHLHYEILMGGQQINPAGVKLRTGQTLAGKEYAEFKKQVKQVESVADETPQRIQVASLAR